MSTVRLLGGARSTERLPPREADEERWSLNAVCVSKFMGDTRDWTRWFDIHPLEHIRRVRPGAYRWYQAQNAARPIYMGYVDPTIAASTLYPVETVLRRFPREEYLFLSSFDWMMALAVLEDFKNIDIHWFRMCNPRYAWQIPSAIAWIAIARALGRTVTIHGDSALNPDRKLYGFEAITIQELVSKPYWSGHA